MDPTTRAFVADIHHFIDARGLDLVHFGKKQGRYHPAAPGELHQRGGGDACRAGAGEGGVWRTQRRYHADGSSYAWLVRSSAFINHFYFYCVDVAFGPFFLKFGIYFPYTAKLYQRQRVGQTPGCQGRDRLRRPGQRTRRRRRIPLPCRPPATASAPAHIDALLRKWLRILAHPFTEEDIAADSDYT